VFFSVVLWVFHHHTEFYCKFIPLLSLVRKISSANRKEPNRGKMNSSPCAKRRLGVSQSGCQARSMGKSVPRHPQLERLEASVGSILAGWCLACGTQAARQVQLERRGGIAIHRQHPSQKKFAPIRRPLFPGGANLSVYNFGVVSSPGHQAPLSSSNARR
jgi:hypothetical protein